MVLTGRRVSLDSIGRLVYAVRSIVREVVVFDYRSAVPDTGASTVFRLGDTPVAARDALLARLEQAGRDARLHASGAGGGAAIDRARRRVARLSRAPGLPRIRRP